MLLDIRKHIVEEAVSMNPAFDYDGLDEEVAQALVDLSHYGERSREPPDEICQTAGQSVCLGEIVKLPPAIVRAAQNEDLRDI